MFPTRPDHLHRAPYLLKQLGVALCYLLLHYVGEKYFEGDDIVGYFESASGFALAVLLIGGGGMWAACS